MCIYDVEHMHVPVKHSSIACRELSPNKGTKSLPLGSGVSPRKLGMDAKGHLMETVSRGLFRVQNTIFSCEGSPRLLPAPAPTSNTLKARNAATQKE